MRIRITRRQLALGLLAVASGSAVSVWSFYGKDGASIELELPEVGNPFSPTYEVFLALSRIVLARERLDEDVAKKLFSVFLDEPWGSKHIGHAYAVLREELGRTTGDTHGGAISLLQLGEGERWFVGHLLTTWYLGIYYHEQRPTQRITHAGALMFEAVQGLVPVTYLESVGYGNWIGPPSGAVKTENDRHGG